MLSVVHVCTDFWPSTGGIQQFVRDLAGHSVRAGMRVTVLCFNRATGFAGPLPAAGVLDGVSIRRVPFIELKYYKPVAVPLSVLKSHDVVHVHGIGAPLDFVAFMKFLHRRPVVVSTHGGIFHTSALAGLKRAYFYGPLRWTMKSVDLVAACSKSDARLFSTVTKRVVLMENGVAISAHLTLPLDGKVPGRFLYVGRLSGNKGIDLLLRAAAAAKQKSARFTLHVAGPDVEGQLGRFAGLADSLGLSDHVVFLGELGQEALMREFASAETFVSASQYEGFGLAAMEAKAAGCRLLLHGNDAFRSLFDSDPAATLVDFNAPDCAGDAWSKLTLNPERVSLTDSRKEAERYSWESRISHWSAVYRGLADGEAVSRELAATRESRPHS